MKMETENDIKRVGIYTQVSAEATAVGEGLALKREKSPVATTEIKEYLKKENDARESDERHGSYTSNDCENNTSLYEDIKSERGPGSSSAGDDSQSNNSRSTVRYRASYTLKPGTRGYERDKMNRATKLREFPRAQRHYGEERWSKSVAALQNIGFVNWEINTMLQELDRLAENKELEEARSRKRKSMPPTTLDQPVKVQRLETDVTSHIPPATVDERDQQYLKCDLRVNIGDASQPDFHILPEFRILLQDEVHILVKLADMKHVVIKRSMYINQTLMVDCAAPQTKDFLKTRLSKLNRLWPGAELVFCPRIAPKQRVKIFIPYLGIETDDILYIIRKQNKLLTEAWTVNKREDLENGICLDVIFDEMASLRILVDQDDLYFLLTRATVKVVTGHL